VSGRRLISERDVRRAARDGAKTLDAAGAVVTPSARDAAGRMGVSFTGETAGERPGAAGTSRAGGGRVQAGAKGRQGTSAGGSAASPARGAPPRQQSAPTSVAPKDQKTAAGTTPSPANGAATAAAARLAIAVGADHGGVGMKDAIAAHLRAAGHAVTDMGTTGAAAVDYPDFASAVAREVAAGRARFGVMVDGAGIGSCMAANKVAGARAAMCYDVTSATNAREHNDANVLTLGAGLIGPRLALVIVDTFLATPYAGGRHQSRVDKVNALDRR
jgi:ribose 5-phosphate isomerase B